MSLVVNNNLMAANTARNLNAHYGRLATSTQRLSSGLRVNSAADDAAGLAIRELQRADIAALHQGARNANDAISMIQVADGSLGIIDEKLIRMKELAEQAATGTYDSTQRMMIESEYQAMASEITRIANATDFNGTKLLDGTLDGEHDGSRLVSEGKMKIHFGTGNDSAEDYYYVEIGECTSEALGLGNNSTWQDVQRRANVAFKDSMQKSIKASDKLDQDEKAILLAQVDKIAEKVDEAIKNAVDPVNAYQLWSAPDGVGVDADGKPTYNKDADTGFLKPGKNWPGNSNLMNDFLAAGAGLAPKAADAAGAAVVAANAPAALAVPDTVAQMMADEATANTSTAKKQLETAIGALKTVTVDTDQATQIKNVVTGAMKDTSLDDNNYKTTLGNIVDKYIADKNNSLAGADGKYDPTLLDGLLTELNTSIDSDVATGGLGVALEAAKKTQEDTYPTDPDELASKLQNVFKNSIQQSVTDNGNTLPDENAAKTAVAAAITAVGEAAAKAGMSDVDVTALTATLTNDTSLVETLWDDTGNAYKMDWNATLPTALEKDTILGAKNTQIQNTTTVNKTDLTNAVTEAKDIIAKGGAANTPIPDKTPLPGIDDPDNEQALKDFYYGLRETEQQKLQYAWGQAAIYNLANADPATEWAAFGISADLTLVDEVKGKMKTDASKEEFQRIFDQAMDDMYAKVGHMDFAGHTIETQEDAQMALEAINDAIVSKDKIRAHLGAAQNRLENTVSNLNIQAENLQAAESRISDVDVATEMTQFVRNQILTQSAVAMLSQANSLPQMAMQLIGG